MGPDSSLWYVMIGDAETGPLTRVELGVELASGSITPDSLVWKEGMINWLPGAKVPELAALFKNPPRSPRAAGARPPPPPKPQEKGAGLTDFDTAHFRLADLAPEDSGQSRNMEFDTAHFRLQDLKNEDSAQSRQMEFDTAHFRLQDLKGVQGARALVPKRIVPKGAEPPIELDAPAPPSPGKAAKSTLKPASTAAAKPLPAAPVAVRQAPSGPVAGRPSKPNPPPVAARVPPPKQAAIIAKGTPRPAGKPAVEEAFDPNRTSVDFRTLGKLVEQQQQAQSMFESAIVPDEAPVEEEQAAPDPKAAELSEWAARELAAVGKGDPPPAAPAPPVPAAKAHEPAPDLAVLKAKAIAAEAPKRSWIPTAIAICGGLALVAALAWYFIAD